jgi:soluble lytic murein transglycosylase
VQAVAWAKEWIEQHAEPHNAKIDPIDWMSASRFRQTRNYVPRVIENMQAHRAAEDT